ncbi:LysR family transcriptional regulator [Pigmentiphaga soli]|uniref:LysR family transcriptional regulator n=1 Tax=Pigmentiphaga soli TaxID=1007095 RepID=A0ABP8GV28_9BURK
MTTPDRAHWLLRSRLKMRQILLLAALGDLANLRRAAAQLGMTQPAATKLLHELEAALNVPLFERSRRGMAATLYGEAMIRHARALLSDLDAARDEIDALAGGSAGTVAVGTMTSTASELVPRAVASLLARSPDVRVSLVEGAHDMLMGALQRGELDLVLGRVMGGAAMDELELEVLYEDKFLVVCGPQHPLAKKRKIRLADLTGQRWILPPATAPLRQRLDILFMEQAGDKPRNAVESVSLLSNLSLLQKSPALAVMPADLVGQFSGSGLVRALPVPLPGLFGPVALITRGGRRRSPAVDAFIGELRRLAR